MYEGCRQACNWCIEIYSHCWLQGISNIMDTGQRLSCAQASPRIVNGQHIAWCQYPQVSSDVSISIVCPPPGCHGLARLGSDWAECSCSGQPLTVCLQAGQFTSLQLQVFTGEKLGPKYATDDKTNWTALFTIQRCTLHIYWSMIHVGWVLGQVTMGGTLHAWHHSITCGRVCDAARAQTTRSTGRLAAATSG